MNRYLKTAILSVAVGATVLAPLSAANARDWRRHHHSHRGGGDALAAGVVGLAAGALIGSALSRSSPDYYEPRANYYEPRADYYEPRYVVRRAPARQYYPTSYAGTLEPWSPEWYDYCSDRYRSFNARSGTFTGYDGGQHFCVAN